MRQILMGTVVSAMGVMVATTSSHSFASIAMGSVQVGMGLLLLSLGVIKLARIAQHAERHS